eukprot:363747-Chlamydomonas_euryale.AAC.6
MLLGGIDVANPSDQRPMVRSRPRPFQAHDAHHHSRRSLSLMLPCRCCRRCRCWRVRRLDMASVV